LTPKFEKTSINTIICMFLQKSLSIPILNLFHCGPPEYLAKRAAQLPAYKTKNPWLIY
jgi:hypothetical protein